MMAWWGENNIPGPVLLANRDNAAALKDYAPESDTVTAAQEQALERVTCGGVKAAKLAGDIFNNKNDKKGHHDTFHWWWKANVQENLTFPDTSNNRFQSYCEAAATLILHFPHYVRFLEFIREKKQTLQFSHMEQNLWNALHCNATKTELVVLALYAQVITHPYIQQICKPGVNMLKLGPLHHQVHAHMKRILEDPDFLLGPAVTHETGALDGQPWHSPRVVAAIYQIAPELPHLRGIMIAFFQGAYDTWKHFISEFSPGGLIDEATADECELAWMPPTNDVNEGALGSFRVLMQWQPQLTLLQYNAQAMFHHNETEQFMDENFQPEDYKFLCKMAHDADSHKLEAMRKKAQVEYDQAKNAKKAAARRTRH